MLHLRNYLPGQHYSNMNAHPDHLRSSSNADSDSVGLGWALGFCISKEHQGSKEMLKEQSKVAGLRATF